MDKVYAKKWERLNLLGPHRTEKYFYCKKSRVITQCTVILYKTTKTLYLDFSHFKDQGLTQRDEKMGIERAEERSDSWERFWKD